MRAVIDTNVLISGIFFSGPPAQILAAWREGRVTFTTSPEILTEHRDVCERFEARYPAIEITEILFLIIKNSVIADPPALTEKVSADPDDDKFIACAIAGGSQIIVSGDSDLLRVSGFQDIKVLTPREFYDTYCA